MRIETELVLTFKEDGKHGVTKRLTMLESEVIQNLKVDDYIAVNGIDCQIASKKHVLWAKFDGSKYRCVIGLRYFKGDLKGFANG